MRRIRLGCFTLGVVLATALAPAAYAQNWVAAWHAPMDNIGPSFDAQSLRQVVRITASGSSLRLRLSNLNGKAPLVIGPVHVALSAGGAAIKGGSDHPVLFNGKPTVTIASGQSALSDPVSMPVQALQPLAISMYLPHNTGPSTVHALGQATAYISEHGDASAQVDFPQQEFTSNRPFLTDVQVSGNALEPVLVTLGDSITDGYNSTANANHRWPDVLAERLTSVSVVNAGISGNRVLQEGAGPSALARFDRDVLEQPGVRWVVLLEGINDIGRSSQPDVPADAVSAQQIIDGMKTLIARAHAHGVKIYGATLTPFEGADFPYHTAAAEQKREAVNEWIRHGGAFDAVIDFDQITRDPAHPTRFLPGYDSGDHLHPSDAGYKAMGEAIDLKLFAKG